MIASSGPTAGHQHVLDQGDEHILGGFLAARVAQHDGQVRLVQGHPDVFGVVPAGAVEAVQRDDERNCHRLLRAQGRFRSSSRSNCFDGARRYDTEDVRMALDLEPDLPIVLCDARSKESAKDVLIALVEHVLVTASEEPLSGIA